jgi:hypothetical protein
MSIRMNDSFGTFGEQVFYDSGEGPYSIALGDLDGDLDLDVAIANSGGPVPDDGYHVSIFLNNGDGTFPPHNQYSVDVWPVFVALGDIDGDVDLDMVVVNGNSDNISVLKNFGNGTFTFDVLYDVGRKPFSVAMADWDGDSDLDLAVPSRSYHYISLLKNDGDGFFPSQTILGSGGLGSFYAVAADLDDDSDPDLAVSNVVSDDISVMLNDCPCPWDLGGDGSIGTADLLDLLAAWGTNPGHPADFDGDGNVGTADLLELLANWGPC